MAFIFTLANTEIQSGTLDLLNGQFDLYIVTAAPSLNNTTVSNLTLSNSNVVLLTNAFTSTIWSFSDIVLPLITYSVAPVGFVISKRSTSTSQTTDRVVYYSEFINSLGQIITYTTGLFRINITFKLTGLIAFNATNEYFSGPYINNETIPKGLIYLLGSDNNTVTFTNPSPSKVSIIGNATGSNGGLSITDRIIATDNTAYDGTIAFDFGTRLIRVGVLGIRYNNYVTQGTLWATNSDNISFTQAGISNNIDWTQIGTTPGAASNVWEFTTSNNSNYWRYVKINGNLNIMDIEFYNSSILSSTVNLV